MFNTGACFIWGSYDESVAREDLWAFLLIAYRAHSFSYSA